MSTERNLTTRGRILWSLAVMAALVVPGCSHPGKGLQTGSYERGIAEFEGERWFDAVETLKLFVRRNPTDPRVDEAQFHIGMARYRDEDFPVAAVEFEILRHDYPNSELLEEAWYMEGMSYVEQMPPVHLEQGVTRKALDHFRRYLAEFPDGARRADVQKQVAALQLHLDQKGFATVRLYRRLGRDKAALISLDVLIEERRDSQLRPQMLFLAGELHRDLDDSDAARASWNQLVSEFPEHELAARARRAIQALGAGATTALDTEEGGR